MQTKRLVVRVPDDIKAWLEKQARYYGGTLGSEVSKSCRERMEREAAASLAKGKPPAIANAAAAE